MSDISLLEQQYVYEDLYNKNQLNRVMRQQFDDPWIKEQCAQHELPPAFTIDALAQMAIHRKATLPTLVGILAHHMQSEIDHALDLTPSQAECQKCADTLLKIAEADLLHYVHEPGGPRKQGMFHLAIDVDDSVKEELERYRFPLPFLVPPSEVTRNNETGYYADHSKYGSLVLRNPHPEGDICLDHINRVNQIPLQLNLDVLVNVKNNWRNLDRQKPNESWGDYQKRKRAFEKYDTASRDVIDHVVMLGNRFWLSHRYDKRGRCYAHAYHIHPQGNDWNKSVIELVNQELVDGF